MNPRTATITFVAGSRLLAAGLVVLPTLARTTSAVVLFFVLALASLTLHAQATSTLSAWMLDFVPDSIRGAYTSRRLAVSLVVTSALSLVAGRLLDALGAGRTAFGIVLLVAAASASPRSCSCAASPHGGTTAPPTNPASACGPCSTTAAT